LSGPDALTIAASLFSAAEGGQLSSHRGFTRLFGDLRLDEDRCVPGECYLFRAPRSYTRQDCVELHTVGSPPLLAMLTELAVSRGARLAEPGEFTARAFLSGALDLTQVEAVAATIRARSDAQLRAAGALRRGDLSTQIAAACDTLAELASLVEADIDFAEEPIDFITPGELQKRLGLLHQELGRLIERSDSTERLSALPSVLLVGAANAGKSSLTNALSGMDRAICSAVAGTTRDVLSAPIALQRGEALLLDAAGHDPPDDRLTVLARAAAESVAAEADLICLVVDLTREPDDHTWAPLRATGRRRAVVAANKIDLLDEATVARRVTNLAEARAGPVRPVSATARIGLGALREAIEHELSGGPGIGEDRALALTARQRGSLEAACAALDRARGLAVEADQTIDSADLVAVELREALDALGAITGAVTTDDLLGRVFASFCIGK
jgi:tRNA modification GTPase